MSDNRTNEHTTRRDLLVGSLVLGLGISASVALPMPDAAGSAPDLDDPAVSLRSLVRLQGSLDESEVPWWYTGLIFAICGERQPRPLLRFEGLEMQGFRHVADGYRLGGRALTFFRDAATNEYLREFRNPWTGRTDEVEPLVYGGDVGYHCSTAGIVPVKRDGQRLRVAPLAGPSLRWHTSREHVWLEQQTVYPVGMPAMHAQRQTTFAARAALLDEHIVALPATFAATVFSGWPAWMRMQDLPGHLVWHVSGAKLASLADLPRDYLERVERESPATLNARHANHAAMGLAMAATDASDRPIAFSSR